MSSLPERVFICPYCQYYSDRRWALERHLYLKHDLYKKDAKEISYSCSYLLNPFYRRKKVYGTGNKKEA